MAFDPPEASPGPWIDIGAAEDLPPGTMQRYESEGQRILIANIDGTPFAVDDTCTHEDPVERAYSLAHVFAHAQAYPR